MASLKTYYYLTKPGIIYGNAITAAAGFGLASRGHVNSALFLAMLAGLSLVIASACVANNILDRRIDALMPRTKRRALVTGRVTTAFAARYSAVLGVLGVLTLLVFTNMLTLATAAFGWLAYVVIYGYAKRKTTWGTEVGSISGAIPPVVGYAAVTGRLDQAALIVFLIVVVWQMPHFYAIAIFRRPDYAAASIPVLPVKQGIPATKIRMLIYIVMFIVVTQSLVALGFAGLAYALVAALLGLGWLTLCLKGFTVTDDVAWARQMFFFSLIVITVLSAAIALGAK